MPTPTVVSKFISPTGSKLHILFSTAMATGVSGFAMTGYTLTGGAITGNMISFNVSPRIASGVELLGLLYPNGGSVTSTTSDPLLAWAEQTSPDGDVQNLSEYTAASADPPTAAEMVTLIKQALKDNPVGIVNITIDGKSTQWDRGQAISELKYWTKLAGQEGKTRPRVMSVRLDRGFDSY